MRKLTFLDHPFSGHESLVMNFFSPSTAEKNHLVVLCRVTIIILKNFIYKLEAPQDEFFVNVGFHLCRQLWACTFISRFSCGFLRKHYFCNPLTDVIIINVKTKHRVEFFYLVTLLEISLQFCVAIL